MNDIYAVGVDVGGTNIKVGLVDQDGQVLSKAKLPTLLTRNVDAVLDDVATLVVRAITKANINVDAVAGVGIGSPGPLSPSEGVIRDAANLPGFQNIALRDRVASRTRLPAILTNDADAAAFGEYWVGVGKNIDSMVLFTLGTGIGAGVVIGGQLLHGHFENAAELGHTIVEPNGIPCTCGQRGCLERYASAGNVATRAAERIKAGEDSCLATMEGGVEAITAERVAQAVGTGDKVAKEIWDDACRYLAIGCVNVQHAFNPALVVLGGGMSAAGDLLLGPVRDHFDKLTWKLVDDRPRIVITALHNDAGLIGAAGLMINAAKSNASRIRVSMPPA